MTDWNRFILLALAGLICTLIAMWWTILPLTLFNGWLVGKQMPRYRTYSSAKAKR